MASRKHTQERRERIKHIAETIGLFNVNKTELAAELGIGRTQLYDDIKAICRAGYKKEELDFARLNIDLSLKQVMKHAQYTLASPNATTKEKLVAGKVLIEAVSAYTDFLERFGIKVTAPIVQDNTIRLVWGKKEEHKKE